MRVSDGAFPQLSRGFHNTILKELGRGKTSKAVCLKTKAQTDRCISNMSIINSYLTKSGDLEMTC